MRTVELMRHILAYFNSTVFGHTVRGWIGFGDQWRGETKVCPLGSQLIEQWKAQVLKVDSQVCLSNLYGLMLKNFLLESASF